MIKKEKLGKSIAGNKPIIISSYQAFAFSFSNDSLTNDFQAIS